MSEVAKVKLQIDLEAEATQRALYDPAIVANHTSITIRMERLADHISALEHAGLHEIAHDVLCQDSLWK
ncbi:hypothetical protein [Dictyobacter kobayashii]|uniref:Uncharacterized protein n=1 Tax=Dictyobacter kobayashii TaxID=2014872 RepID=A0A402ASX8_9CHLR|nr:hypothetical protein [Dictyobacter kobayashii]GCE22230.1 hypothetical protein KDK_60300 [Dictyobacter kobayashii]